MHDSSSHLIHTYLASKIPLKGTNKCPFNPSVFLDNRWRWHQSVFHHILADIPLISYCKVFTNKRGLLGFTQFILRGFHLYCFTAKLFLSCFVYIAQDLITPYSHCFDILLACNISTMSHYPSLLEHC